MALGMPMTQNSEKLENVAMVTWKFENAHFQAHFGLDNLMFDRQILQTVKWNGHAIFFMDSLFS